MLGLGEGDLILLLVGVGGAVWCIGLVLALVYADGTHRAKTVRHVGEALFIMLMQMREHRRQHEGAATLP